MVSLLGLSRSCGSVSQLGNSATVPSGSKLESAAISSSDSRLVAVTAVAFVVSYRSLKAQIKLSVMKDDFISNMSHELKTPLANIREGTELLMDGAVGTLANEQREVLDILRENERLAREVRPARKVAA